MFFRSRDWRSSATGAPRRMSITHRGSRPRAPGTHAILLVAALLACSCGEQPTSPEQAAHVARPAATGSAASSEPPNAAKAPEAAATPPEHKGGSVGVQIMRKTDLPSDYPDDVPVYPGANPANTSRGPNGRLVVLFGTSDSIDAVGTYMDEALRKAGWSLQAAQQGDEGWSVIKAGKSGRSVSILIKRVDEGKPSEATLLVVMIDA